MKLQAHETILKCEDIHKNQKYMRTIPRKLGQQANHQYQQANSWNKLHIITDQHKERGDQEVLKDIKPGIDNGREALQPKS